MCGSGMQAVMAADAIARGQRRRDRRRAAWSRMSNAPYLSKKHRAGARIGHDTVYDHMMLDGLEDAYEPGRAMGTFAEATAGEYQLHPRERRTIMPSPASPAPRPPRPAAGSTRRSRQSR